MLLCVFQVFQGRHSRMRLETLKERSSHTSSVVVGMRATPINRLGCVATTFAISSFAILQALGFTTRGEGDKDIQQCQNGSARNMHIGATTPKTINRTFRGEKLDELLFHLQGSPSEALGREDTQGKLRRRAVWLKKKQRTTTSR